MSSKTPPDVYDSFKPFRNNLQQYEPLSVVISAIERLHWLEKKDNVSQWEGWTAWDLLLIIKWCFALSGNSRNKKCDLKGLGVLCSKVTTVKGPEQRILSQPYKAVAFKFLRIMAFKKFWLQKSEWVGSEDLSRLIFLFLQNNDSSYPFEEKFIQVTGVSVKTFIELNIMTWNQFALKKGKPYVD